MEPLTDWPLPPPDVVLRPQDLHIWLAALDGAANLWPPFWPLLAPDEQERANRFHRAKDKNTFVTTRGILRVLISRYLAVLPDQIQFTYSKHGKPSLMSAPETRALQFNVAHSHNLALFAFCYDSVIGVDVEKIRPFPDAEQIAARFFSDHENKTFQTIPAAQRYAVFFHGWTRKEAFIKALGEGLSYPLDQFDVTLLPGESARLIQIKESKLEAARWSLYTLAPMPGYIGAVAAAGQDWALSCWRWPET